MKIKRRYYINKETLSVKSALSYIKVGHYLGDLKMCIKFNDLELSGFPYTKEDIEVIEKVIKLIKQDNWTFGIVKEGD